MTLSSIWPPRTIVAKRSCTEATSRLFFPFVNVPLGTFCLITSLILTKMLDLTADYKLRENEKKKKEKKRKKRNCNTTKAAQYYSEWTAEQWFERKALRGEREREYLRCFHSWTQNIIPVTSCTAEEQTKRNKTPLKVLFLSGWTRFLWRQSILQSWSWRKGVLQPLLCSLLSAPAFSLPTLWLHLFRHVLSGHTHPWGTTNDPSADLCGIPSSCRFPTDNRFSAASSLQTQRPLTLPHERLPHPQPSAHTQKQDLLSDGSCIRGSSV